MFNVLQPFSRYVSTTLPSFRNKRATTSEFESNGVESMTTITHERNVSNSRTRCYYKYGREPGDLVFTRRRITFPLSLSSSLARADVHRRRRAPVPRRPASVSPTTRARPTGHHRDGGIFRATFFRSSTVRFDEKVFSTRPSPRTFLLARSKRTPFHVRAVVRASVFLFSPTTRVDGPRKDARNVRVPSLYRRVFFLYRLVSRRPTTRPRVTYVTVFLSARSHTRVLSNAQSIWGTGVARCEKAPGH